MSASQSDFKYIQYIAGHTNIATKSAEKIAAISPSPLVSIPLKTPPIVVVKITEDMQVDG